MSKNQRVLIHALVGLQILWATPLAVVVGYKWLAKDEPNRSYGCTTGRTHGTCYEGESTNMLLTLVFGSIAVIAIAILMINIVMWRSGDAREVRLRASGHRVPGVVTRVERTNTKINGARVKKMRIEAHPPGMEPIVLTRRSTRPVAEGTRVTIAFDPEDPSKACTMEALEQLAAYQANARRTGASIRF